MIFSLIAGLSVLLLLGLFKTGISYVLIDKFQEKS